MPGSQISTIRPARLLILAALLAMVPSAGHSGPIGQAGGVMRGAYRPCTGPEPSEEEHLFFRFRGRLPSDDGNRNYITGVGFGGGGCGGQFSYLYFFGWGSQEGYGSWGCTSAQMTVVSSDPIAVPTDHGTLHPGLTWQIRAQCVVTTPPDSAYTPFELIAFLTSEVEEGPWNHWDGVYVTNKQS